MTVRPLPICKTRLASNDSNLTDTRKNESKKGFKVAVRYCDVKAYNDADCDYACF